MKTTNLLDQPITSLKLSPAFQEMAETNHFKTLSEMMEFTLEELQRMPLFDLRMVAEYVKFLTENGLDVGD
ncbi:MAG: hypothetical protein ABJN36_17630 [Cyclobacteriaceae bacterium]